MKYLNNAKMITPNMKICVGIILRMKRRIKMVVCKFSVVDGILNICAISNRFIECDGIDEGRENCPFWNSTGSPYPKKRK